MSKKLLIILVVAAALFSLTFFTVPVSASGTGFSTLTVSALNTPSNVISVDDTDDGKTATLCIADRLKVSLNYIAGVPLNWNVSQCDAGKLDLYNNYRIPPSSLGGTGIEVWEFKAVGLGVTTLIIQYCELDGTPVGTYTVTISVTAAPQVPASSNVATGILAAGLTGGIAWLGLRKIRQVKI
jgi:hypothetical protein